MDTTQLLPAGSLGDPLGPKSGLAGTVLLHWPERVGADDIGTARGAIERLTLTRPATPDPDGKALVVRLADDLLAAAIGGHDLDDLADRSREGVAKLDAEHVAYSASLLASARAERHLSGVVRKHAAGAYEAWTIQARTIGEAYMQALGGRPAGTELEALRDGKSGATRWNRLIDLRGQYAGIATSWRALRLLTASGDREVFDAAARFDRRPDGSLRKIEEWSRHHPEDTLLDVAASLALHDALVLDSREQQRERVARWDSEERTRPRRRAS